MDSMKQSSSSLSHSFDVNEECKQESDQKNQTESSFETTKKTIQFNNLTEMFDYLLQRIVAIRGMMKEDKKTPFFTSATLSMIHPQVPFKLRSLLCSMLVSGDFPETWFECVCALVQSKDGQELHHLCQLLWSTTSIGLTTGYLLKHLSATQIDKALTILRQGIENCKDFPDAFHEMTHNLLGFACAVMDYICTSKTLIPFFKESKLSSHIMALLKLFQSHPRQKLLFDTSMLLRGCFWMLSTPEYKDLWTNEQCQQLIQVHLSNCSAFLDETCVELTEKAQYVLSQILDERIFQTMSKNTRDLYSGLPPESKWKISRGLTVDMVQAVVFVHRVIFMVCKPALPSESIVLSCKASIRATGIYFWSCGARAVFGALEQILHPTEEFSRQKVTSDFRKITTKPNAETYIRNKQSFKLHLNVLRLLMNRDVHKGTGHCFYCMADVQDDNIPPAFAQERLQDNKQILAEMKKAGVVVGIIGEEWHTNIDTQVLGGCSCCNLARYSIFVFFFFFVFNTYIYIYLCVFRYCSKKCQKADWKLHKNFCSKK